MLRRIILLLVASLTVSVSARAQSTAFTYQGRLTDNGLQPTSSYDMEFRLFDALEGGNQMPQGSPITITLSGSQVVSVANGVFTVQLDFGGLTAFNGNARWLQIAVKKPTDSSFAPLTPRQPVSSTPYAIRSLNAASADTATNSSQLAGVAASQYILTSDTRLSDPRPPTAGSSNYIQNTTSQQSNANINISGNALVGGMVGIGTTAPFAVLNVVGTQPPTRFSGGSNASLVLQIIGGTGGNSLQGNAGTGAGVTIQAGVGGDSNPIGGAGGSITLQPGSGGFGGNVRNGANGSLLLAPSFGNVGIGTDIPGKKLDIVAATVEDGIRVSGTTSGAISPAISLYDSGNQRSVLGLAELAGHFSTSSAVGDTVLRAITGKLILQTGPTSGSLIINSGSVGIGITPDVANKLQVNGLISTQLASNGSESVCRNILAQLAFCSSSLRYKTNVTHYSSGLGLIRRLAPITFNWKQGGMKDLGLRAEDVEQVEPLLVTYDSAGAVQGVKYDRVAVVLINAIKEQQQQIEQLKAEVRRLNSASHRRRHKMSPARPCSLSSEGSKQ